MMKNIRFKFNNYKTPRKGLFIIASMALLSLSSCLKDDEMTIIDASAISVINASPGLAPFDFVLDNKVINNGSFSYTSRLQYIDIFSGSRRFGIYRDDTTDSIKTGTLNAVKNKIYSIYVVGQGTQPEFLTITDSLRAPATGKARIRFLNLAVNTPATSLNYGVDSTLFTNVNYKGHTAYVEIPGGKRYNFSIKSTANAVDTLGSVKNVLIESGKIYSVWSRGIYNSTIDSLKTGVKVQINN